MTSLRTPLSPAAFSKPENAAQWRILAADIGGTNSRFADFLLHPAPQPELELTRRLRLSTATVSSFPDLLALLASEWGDLSIFDAAALAVPGPVVHERRCHLPNVPWQHIDLDLAPLARVWLLNDFAAQGWACFCPEAQDLRCILPGCPPESRPDGSSDLHPAPSDPRTLPGCSSAPRPGGSPDPHAVPGVKAVFGPGTGVGLCAVLPGSPPAILCSEGGHCRFPFLPTEHDYAAFLRARVMETQVEDVIAGRGLTHLHAYHCGEEKSPGEVAALMLGTPVLADYARYVGRAARDWILSTTSTGGLWLTGGILAANPHIVTHPAFAQSLYSGTTHTPLVQNNPVWLVQNTDAALWGAALYAAQKLAG